MGATSFEVHDFNNDGIIDIGIAREVKENGLLRFGLAMVI